MKYDVRIRKKGERWVLERLVKGKVIKSTALHPGKLDRIMSTNSAENVSNSPRDDIKNKGETFAQDLLSEGQKQQVGQVLEDIMNPYIHIPSHEEIKKMLEIKEKVEKERLEKEKKNESD